MIVVDASLATKWFLAELDSHAALIILERHVGQLHGPDVLRVEVSRALVSAANARRIDKATALTLFDSWLRTIAEGISLHSHDDDLLERGVAIALDLGHPLADCLYLSLALELGADLITADAKFHARAHKAYPTVKLIADYGD